MKSILFRYRYCSELAYFAQNRGLAVVPDDIPDEVTFFYLSGNDISKIPSDVFANLNRCVELDLSNNNISQIEPGAFNGLKNLETLDLSNNKLNSLGNGTLSGLSSLTVLNLNGNLLVTLDSDTFEDLPRLPLKLNLGNNPQLRCNNSLCWLKREAESGTIEWFHDGRPECSFCCPRYFWLDLTCPGGNCYLLIGLSNLLQKTCGDR